MARLQEWIEGRTIDGNPLPLDKSNAYRACRGLPPLDGTSTPTPPQLKPWVGLGDFVAFSIDKTGGTARVKRFFARFGITNCGCTRRRKWLNKWVPFTWAGWAAWPKGLRSEMVLADLPPDERVAVVRRKFGKMGVTVYRKSR